MEESKGQDIDLTRNPYQEAFVFDDRRFLVWFGGRGSSKTSSTCLHIMRLMDDPAWYGARWLFAAPIYAQIKKGPLLTFDEWFEPRGLILEKLSGNEPERKCVNGWTVFFRNASNPESWRGLEIAGGSLDEAGLLGDRRPFQLINASMRQRHPDGRHYAYQTTITTTPRGKNWLYRDFVDPASRKYDDQQLGLYQTTTHDAMEAGFLPEDYIEHMGYQLGSEMYQQEIMGDFVSWSGLVFDQTWKTPDPFVLPRFRAVYGGIDVGTADPTAIVIVGQDERGAVWVIKEWYQPRAKFEEWVDIVGRWTREYQVRRWFVDSDATEKMLRVAGLPVRQPYKAKDAAAVSINYLNSLMSRGMLYVAPDCHALRMEMEMYRYKDRLEGDEATIIAKIAPGQPDHACDALRYASYSLSGSQAAASWGEHVPFSVGGRIRRRRENGYRRVA